MWHQNKIQSSIIFCNTDNLVHVFQLVQSLSLCCHRGCIHISWIHTYWHVSTISQAVVRHFASFHNVVPGCSIVQSIQFQIQDTSQDAGEGEGVWKHLEVTVSEVSLVEYSLLKLVSEGNVFVFLLDQIWTHLVTICLTYKIIQLTNET